MQECETASYTELLRDCYVGVPSENKLVSIQIKLLYHDRMLQIKFSLLCFKFKKIFIIKNLKY